MKILHPDLNRKFRVSLIYIHRHSFFLSLHIYLIANLIDRCDRSHIGWRKKVSTVYEVDKIVDTKMDE